MLSYPQLSPEAFRLGPLAVRWYGLMYLFGFLAAWLLGRLRTDRPLSRRRLEEALTWSMFGVVLGARLGYVLFYDPAFYLAQPSRILHVWQGGMSFHGGLAGTLCALWLYARRRGLPLFALLDGIAPLAAPGLFFGRLGNFINAELWGRVTDVPWGMVFPGAGPLPRHPSQLYEAFLEGLVLFVLVWAFSAKPRPLYAVSGVFAVGYGLLRGFAEFFRQPDPHLGYLAFGWATMGMLLCLPLLAAGLVLLWLAYGRRKTPDRRAVK
jgi:phosphatidylglycerol:prolipoprotein diacylglycerol transferase